MLHTHGSSNPNGITGNGDRIAMHPYFLFKDLVTIFAFILTLTIIVCWYPNVLGQIWPSIIIFSIIDICAICWKDILNYSMNFLVKNYNKTIYISDLFLIINHRIIIKLFIINPYIVKYYYNIYNQQITKRIYKSILRIVSLVYILLVGISETIRTLKFNIISIYIKNFSFSTITKNLNIIKDNHNNEISLKFRQWFAGLVDGDGYLYVNSKGMVGFELTLPSEDEKVLRIIQNKFGGNIHPRGGLKAIRYRTQKREVLCKIVNCLNGLVINNIRLTQLHKACLALNIPIIDPVLPDSNSAYLSGLLDSDGTINIYKINYNNTFRYQLTISITNKSRSNIEFILNIFNGKIYFDKSKNGSYKWVANSKILHLNLYDYFLKYPPKTIKSHRTFLIKEFHDLASKKVYLETNESTINYKIWKNFKLKWDK